MKFYNIFKKIFKIEKQYVKFQLFTIIHLLGFKIKFKSQKYKKYIKIIPKMIKKESLNIKSENIHSDYVFTMWLQEEIPQIIQICLHTIKNFYPNAIILNQNNIKEYVKIPDYILNKYKSGKIISAHFSDYIRCCLLDKYGGLWIDASCYMINKVPKFITKQEFLIPTSPNKLKSISNFFIYSTSNNYIIKCMKNFLELYWKENDIADNYFFFHKAFNLFRNSDLKFKKICDGTPVLYNTMLRYLVDNACYDFDNNLWDYLKSASFMYKINRKDSKAMNNPTGFYQYLLETNSNPCGSRERERERERERVISLTTYKQNKFKQVA